MAQSPDMPQKMDNANKQVEGRGGNQADPSVNYEVRPSALKNNAQNNPPNSDNNGWNEEREHLHRQMLSAVSHDLKTPLASIIGSLEIYERMKEQLKPEKKDMLLHTALVEAYRLDTFLTNILDMAKLENDLITIRRVETDIGAVLQSVLDNMKMRMGDAVASLQGGALIAHVDAGLFGRAIGLLIDNAVKHGALQNAEANTQITINYRREARADGDYLLVDVCDNGAGVPADKMEDIFSKYTRFARGDRQNAGTGLGLPIARTIAMRLGGNLLVENKPDGGARFTFSAKI